MGYQDIKVQVHLQHVRRQECQQLKKISPVLYLANIEYDERRRGKIEQPEQEVRYYPAAEKPGEQNVLWGGSGQFYLIGW